MKNIIFISLVIVAIYFGIFNGTNKTIIFNNEEYKMVRKEGIEGYYKYHYTKSGRDTGVNDYIEILKFDKPEFGSDKEKGVANYIKKVYKTKYITGASGQFGVFGENHNEYAYTIRLENTKSYIFVNYVLKSTSLSYREAKDNAATYINSLENIASEL